MSFTVNKLDVVFFQRDSGNTQYEQVNISGSNAIFYLDRSGILTAGKISDVLRSGGTTKASLVHVLV
jgi:sensor domain CHASE-containing protein